MKGAALGIATTVAALSVATVPIFTTMTAQAATHDSPHSIVALSPTDYTARMDAAQEGAAPTAKEIGLGSGEGLVVRSVIADADGTIHTRYDRTYGGLPVIGGDLVVARNAGGAVTSVIKNVEANVQLAANVAPGDKAKARSVALEGVKGQKEVAVTKEGEAVVLRADGTSVMVNAVTTTGVQADQTPSDLTSYVDADGVLVTSVEKVHSGTGNSQYSGTVPLNTVQSGGAWALKDSHGNHTTDLGGAESGTGTLFTDSDNVWGNGSPSDRQTAGVDVQYGAEKTYEYYSKVLGRAGIWGNGQGARSRAHYGQNYVQAYWDGTQASFGDGSGGVHPLTALDVVGHEMSHGLTGNTAGLVYSGEPGGLNEGTSDIFGTAVEFNANNPSDPGDYWMGEKIDIRGNGTPLRYMDQPSRDGVSLDCWFNGMGSRDPHYTSGPLNHWFFMASEGSGARVVNGQRYNSPTCGGAPAVTGGGRSNIEQVWFRALATKLTSNSTYARAREAAITSAIELYGASSQVCASVESAFTAIDVPAGAAECAPGNPDPTPTPTPTSTGTPSPTPTPGPTEDVLKNGGFESGKTAWSGTNGPITTNAGRPARTGKWKAWLGGNGTSASESIGQSVTIPANASSATLSFWLRTDTDETGSTVYDTMKVQVIEGSSTSTLATYSNVGTNATYTQKSFDLSAYKGKTVTVKFVMAEDAHLQTSFVVDDVALTTG